MGILKLASIAYSLSTKAATTLLWAADAEICKSFKLTETIGGEGETGKQEKVDGAGEGK